MQGAAETGAKAEGPRRIALLHPTYWPEVRRGSERVIHDLAAYLAGRGYAPTILTAHRGRPSRRVEDGVEVVRGWRPPDRLQPRRLEPYAGHAPLALVALMRGRFDLVHAFHPPHGAAAAVWAQLRRRPMVLSVMGYPDGRSLDAFQGRRRALRFAAAGAGAVHVLSGAAERALREAAGLRSEAIPPGTAVASFGDEVARDPRPTIFCASSATDPRKRVPDLIEAFALVRRRRPDARLILTGPVPDHLRHRLSDPGVEELSAWIEHDLLVRAYGAAWVTVLASEREAFGQVLVESLAAGTPVVAVRSGAAPEIVDEPQIGVLSESRQPVMLAEAIVAALGLAQRPGIREVCRDHARRWDWGRVGPRFESLYLRAVRASRGE